MHCVACMCGWVSVQGFAVCACKVGSSGHTALGLLSTSSRDSLGWQAGLHAANTRGWDPYMISVVLH
jgi:hypothetical protein